MTLGIFAFTTASNTRAVHDLYVCMCVATCLACCSAAVKLVTFFIHIKFADRQRGPSHWPS